MDKVEKLIQTLDLQPHPEGGYFKETYRSNEMVSYQSLPEGYNGARNYSTCIYFLLTSDMFSAFHKIRQDEIWHFYEGSPIELHTITEDGKHDKYLIGNDFFAGQTPQLVVPGGNWFAAKVFDQGSYSLVGCTVAPGFDFGDFVLADRASLSQQFPHLSELIRDFSR